MVALKGKASSIGNTGLPIFVFGGELRVEGVNTSVNKAFTTLSTTGEPLPQNQAGNVVSVFMSSGKIVIEEGRTLKAVDGGISMRGGLLTTKVNDSVANHLAIINGHLTVEGENAIVQIATEGRPVTGVFVPTLHVEENIYFIRGTYKPTVHAEVGNLHDRWTCKMKFYSAAIAKIDPTVVGSAPFGMSWDVIIAIGGYGDAARPSASVAADWAIDDGDGTSYGQPGWKSINVRKAR